jgi:hypothetical protein
MKGEDVKLLHGELRKLGYRIPAAETSKQVFGASTRQAVTDFQKKHRLEATGVVDERTAKRINAEVGELPQPQPREPGPEPKGCVVRGQVRQADGSLLIGGTVRAFDKDLRSEEMLGKAQTDRDGRYEIKYTAGQFRRAEKQSADLIVRVLSRDGLPLAASPIIFNARPEETVDLVIGGEEYRGPSEYELHLAELTPVLQGVELADLTEEDVAFLSGETGIDPEHIAFLVLGARLGRKTDLRADAFYGLFRQNLPTDLPSLLAQSPDVQRRALETALDENVIPVRLRKDLDSILERLRQLIVEHAFQPPDEPGRTSLGDLLNTVLPRREKQKTFLSRYVRHEGPIEDFWKDLRENSELAEDVDKLQFVLQLGILTQNHLPLVRELQKTCKSARDLVKLDADAWKELIQKRVDGQPIGFPPDVPGADNAEKTKNYADLMARMVEESFPTAVISHRLSLDTSPAKKDLRKFLSQSPDFDFGTTLTGSYLARNPGALVGVTDRTRLANQLKEMQRVFRLTPRYSQMRVLLDGNLGSAHAITRMARNVFIRNYREPLGGTAPAEAIYEKALQASATALNLLASYSPMFNAISTHAAPSNPPQVEGIPDLETLFGSLDLCACEHCRSVHGPAAYLVDLLAFLKDRASKVTDPATNRVLSAKEILFKRRPDIGEIELTCENTNTPLPYVDLLNEVLENAVSPATSVSDQDRQTQGTAQELAANPQHLNAGAYDVLRQQAYPWSLPFDLASEEARAYLSHLGVQRHGLMTTFQKAGTLPDPTDIAIAGEHLGLTTVERQIVTRGLAPPLSPWELWGYAAGNPGSWVADLGHVRTFLQKSGLSYEELVELLKLKFVNPDADLRIESNDPTDPTTCDTQKLGIANLTDSAQERIPRFVRLWRKLGWTMRELDKAITALQPADLNDGFLQQLSHIQKLHAELKVPVVTVLAWYAPIDTALYDDQESTRPKSLYEELFQNPAVIKLDPGEPDRFKLNSAGTELEVIGTLTDKKTIAALLAALGASESELSLLIDGSGAVVTSDKKLSLENLSRLYRVVTLARPLRLSVRDFLRLKELTGIDPFANDLSPVTAAVTRNTLRFVEAFQKIRGSGFSTDELDYLLRHRLEAGSTVLPADEIAILILDEIRGGLQKIAAESSSLLDASGTLKLPPTAEFLRSKLAIVLAGSQIERTLAVVDGDSSLTEAEKKNFIDEHFAQFMDPADAKDRLVGPSPDLITEREDRFRFVLGPLLTYLRRTSGESLVTQKLGETLGLEAQTIEQLLTKWVHSPIHPAQSSMSEFLAPVFAESSQDMKLSAAAFPDQFKCFALLHKIATFLSKLRINPEQAAWLFDYGPAVGWLDLNSLPLTAVDSASGLFAGWERLIDLFQLRDAVPFGESMLADVFGMARQDAPAEPTLLQRLSECAGWSLENLQFLASAQGFGFAFPEAYKDERALCRLKAAFAMMQRLGVSADQCRSWAKPDLTSDDARNIKQAVKAKYDDAQWLTIARPLRDILREKQRAALVSYLVARPYLVTLPDNSTAPAWQDAAGLYQFYLIDVEMDPCMMTSRIKQALGSVQLFVQRCLMGLEGAVGADAEADAKWREWKWMRNYRVWEVNRKIFLYPENWLEPELRDEKSPFFKDLENELLQNDVTTDIAEEAFLNYLEELDAVARLEICGIYHQREDDVDILHVFGRTRGIPHVYYYRRRVDSAYWTPWEKVDADIEGDHLVPVVWNRRLHLFWPVFTEATVQRPITMPSAGGTLDEPAKYWKVQIAWSEYKNEKWSAKTVSKETLSGLEFSVPFVSQDRLTFRARFEGTEENRDLLIYFGPSESAFSDTHTGETFYKWPGFRISGCGGTLALSSRTTSTYLPLIPPHTHVEYMKAAEDFGKQRLEILAADTDRDGKLVKGTQSTIPTLELTPGVFRIIYPHQFADFVAQAPFFYQDETKAFLVVPRPTLHPGGPGGAIDKPNRLPLEWVGGSERFSPVNRKHPGTKSPLFPKYRAWKNFRFETFYHPYTCEFIKQLNRHGIDGFLEPPASSPLSRQAIRRDVFFEADYAPTEVVDRPYPVEEVDFSYGGAYSLYNWELFFHAPLLIADRLRRNQRFEEAQKWFHYIFDPTDASGLPMPQRYWRTRRFFETSQSEYQSQQIQKLLQLLALGDADPELSNQVKQWRAHPFKPHLIARLRTAAYQKAVVMKYVDNLIAWGDQLFRRDTIETLNEATQLYVLAAEILGRRPENIPPRSTPHAQSYNSLEPKLDDFSNALVNIENLVPDSQHDGTASSTEQPPLTLPAMLYFCVPKNDALLGYWDKVADRLFKIRHCMNIEGMVRQLPLFEPPIEPGLLVRAAALGVDLTSAINDINAALPHYRFSVMAQKASELCADLKTLGGALLSALEKRDAEALALLRSSQEIEVLNALRQVKEKQVEEAKQALEGLKKARDLVNIRHTYFANLQFMNPGEIAHLALVKRGLSFQAAQARAECTAAVLHLIPNAKTGAPTTLGITYGGSNIASGIQAFGSFMGQTASILNTIGSMSGTLGSYVRRSEDWELQEQLAAKELQQMEQQIIGAEIRLAIAERELQNHDLQVENANAVDAHMHDKFTNRELYDWMVSQISSIYFQSYQLVYDVALRTERAYRYELGLGPEDSNFIQFGYWDSLKKGLLAGERLHQDLKRMEVAYLDQNRREYEITKHIPLTQLDPLALIRLKQTGECFVSLPEALFDLDYPGHYMRRIKSMSITIPCVTGPYTGVNCRLTLLKSSIRKTNTLLGGKHRRQDGDLRFEDSIGAIQSIATSSAQSDSGLFEANLRDERYLPFEGAGAISEWHLELPTGFKQFDYDTISDVVLHLRYTGREGGEPLKHQASADLQAALNELMSSEGQIGLALLLSLRHEFPGAWHRFLNAPTGAAVDQTLTMALAKERFPFLLQNKTIVINAMEIFVKIQPGFAATHNESTLKFSLEAGSAASDTSLTLIPWNGLLRAAKSPAGSPGDWTLTAWLEPMAGACARLNPNAIEDILVVCRFACS